MRDTSIALLRFGRTPGAGTMRHSILAVLAAILVSCQAPVQAPPISAGHRSPGQPAGPSLPSSPCQPVSPAPHGNLKQTGRD